MREQLGNTMAECSEIICKIVMMVNIKIAMQILKQSLHCSPV